MVVPKFRAVFKNKIISEVGSIDFINKTVTIPIYDKETDEYLADYELSLDLVTLMQSTGLFDKNGQEIFEGDVVKIMDEDGDSEISAVTFKHGASGMTITGVFVPFVTMIVEATVDYTLEIISNIHANPELVEGVENE
ncbi:YopX family protein [Streptococcus suis]|uniref:YopX family protein n=1 Tax=Streptococcus suis TaxID=1307 RepID=UPI003F8B9ACC